MKKYFLTTALMGTFIAPAFGADKIITSANTCTFDVLGVSDNNATANTIATWDAIEYTLNPGEYLSVTETSVHKAPCPSGSYCVGGTEFTVDNANTSIATCPTGYENSDAGAGADTQCYTACTVDMVAKATKVTGNDYYGTGTDTCEPTECIAGWHVKPGLDIGETIGEEAGANSAYIDNYGYFEEMNYDGKGKKGQEYYGISDKNNFAVDYAGKGILTGHGRCSTQAGVGIWNGASTPEDITVVNNLVDETGADGAQYCYCQLDGYKSATGETTQIVSTQWLFAIDRGSVDDCNKYCATACGNILVRSDNIQIIFRAAIFNTVGVSPATCAANTINIDWNPDNGGDHIKNMCTYEGEITLPTPDPVKPGYTFTGWKLLENTTNE